MPIMATLVQHGALAWHCGNDMHLQGKPFTTHQGGMDYSNLHVICVLKRSKVVYDSYDEKYNQTTSPDPEHA